jgi:tRNA pseudouridine55 synthase
VTTGAGEAAHLTRNSISRRGVLVVDKTEGPTSHDVVTLARRALGVSRIGHTGTLDPMATGVLPLVIGRATRLAHFLTASDKTYEATVAFGRTTDTLDASGTIVTTCDRRPTRDELRSGDRKFRGTFDQTPPCSPRRTSTASARTISRAGQAHVGGAAQGGAVNVKRLEVLSFDGDSARLEMQVTAGFYVRSLAHDLGAALECGAVLAALRRTQSGEFGLDRPSRWPTVLQSPRESLAERLIPVPGSAARAAVGDAALGDPIGAPQERRRNGAQRPRRAVPAPAHRQPNRREENHLRPARSRRRLGGSGKDRAKTSAISWMGGSG